MACIIMFEKPMGVWAILEEESLFPKATDKTFEDKLKSGLLGKCPPFAKPQSKTDKNAHFAILEEESLFPKATDKTFEDKLKSGLLGKCPPFAKPQSKTDK